MGQEKTSKSCMWEKEITRKLLHFKMQPQLLLPRLLLTYTIKLSFCCYLWLFQNSVMRFLFFLCSIYCNNVLLCSWCSCARLYGNSKSFPYQIYSREFFSQHRQHHSLLNNIWMLPLSSILPSSRFHNFTGVCMCIISRTNH